MTEHLYYDNAYLAAYDAVVEACVLKDSMWHVRMDRSAFYPTSGGQPYDTGSLNGAPVSDVYVDDAHEIWHVTNRAFEVGGCVHGEIDWPRRFDHMQQHAGDHMIASALHRLLGGVTIGLHISNETSTIDVAMPEGSTRISAEDIQRVEMDVNERIQRDVPVRCWFPDENELKALPLRKMPTVKENVRVVAIGTDEMVACGGTHPSTAGQIGLVKILSVSPARGKMRVCFVAGMRAIKDYQFKAKYALETANLLSTGVDKMAGNVSGMMESLKKAEFELVHLRREIYFAQLAEMIGDAKRLPNGTAVVVQMIDGDASLMRDLASHIIKTPNVIALLGVPSGEGQAMFVFARSADVQLHMGQLMGAAAKPLGGKGGGRPDFAQGGGSIQILNAAAELLFSEKFNVGG